MAKRDEFTANTKRILAERAGQRCSNPDCGRNTAGPSDDGSGESTQLGKAAHITAAAEGGPRYDPTLTQEQRHSPGNGIWLCAECADRVDKGENEHQYPVELLRHWKKFHESTTGDRPCIQTKQSLLSSPTVNANQLRGSTRRSHNKFWRTHDLSWNK